MTSISALTSMQNGTPYVREAVKSALASDFHGREPIISDSDCRDKERSRNVSPHFAGVLA